MNIIGKWSSTKKMKFQLLETHNLNSKLHTVAMETGGKCATPTFNSFNNNIY